MSVGGASVVEVSFVAGVPTNGGGGVPALAGV